MGKFFFSKWPILTQKSQKRPKMTKKLIFLKYQVFILKMITFSPWFWKCGFFREKKRPTQSKMAKTDQKWPKITKNEFFLKYQVGILKMTAFFGPIFRTKIFFLPSVRARSKNFIIWFFFGKKIFWTGAPNLTKKNHEKTDP